MRKAKSRFERRLATKIFTDREDPQKLIVGKVKELIADRELYDVVNFYGIGGIGKTSLLDHLHMKLLEESPTDSVYASVYAKVDCVKYDLEAFNSKEDSLQELEAALMDRGFRFVLFEAALELCLPVSQRLSLLERRKNPKTHSKLGSIVLQGASLVAPIDPDLVKNIAIDAADLISDLHEKFAKAFEPAREVLRRWEKRPPTRSELLSHLADYFAMDLQCNIEMRRKPLVVLLDSYEGMVNTYADIASTIDEWLVALFETPGVLWVLAGREYLDLPDVENHLVGKLAFEDASRFLEAAEVDNEYHEMIYNLSDGIPLMLDMCVDIYHGRGEQEVTPALFGAKHGALVDRYARHCMGESDCQVMMMLSALERWTDAEARDFGARLVGQLWTEVEFEHLYDEAMQHSIIVKTDDFRYITRVVQGVFARMLEEDAPVARRVGDAMLEYRGVRIDKENNEVTSYLFESELCEDGWLVDFSPSVDVARALRLRGVADETLSIVGQFISAELIMLYDLFGRDVDGKMTVAAHEMLDALKATVGDNVDMMNVARQCMRLLIRLNSERASEATELAARLVELSEPSAGSFDTEVDLWRSAQVDDALERLAQLERIERRYASVVADDFARQATLHYLHVYLFRYSKLPDTIDDQAFYDEYMKVCQHAEQAHELWERVGVENWDSLHNDYLRTKFYLENEEWEKHDELLWSVYEKSNAMFTANNVLVKDSREDLEQMLLERGEVCSALELIFCGDKHKLTDAEIDTLNNILQGNDEEAKLVATKRMWADEVPDIWTYSEIDYDTLWLMADVLMSNFCYEEARHLFAYLRDAYEADPNIEHMTNRMYALCLYQLGYLSLTAACGSIEPHDDGSYEIQREFDRASGEALLDAVALIEQAYAIAEQIGMDTHEQFLIQPELLGAVMEHVRK